jgi:hypothetical protein
MEKKEILSTPEFKISSVEQIVKDNPETAGLQAYEYLRNTSNNQKQEYIKGDISDVTFEYPYLTKEAIVDLKNPMLKALTSLMPGEKNLKTNSLYDAIEYRYAELFLLDMARIMNNPTNNESDIAQAEKLFKQSSEALYGKPEKNVFSSIASRNLAPNLIDNDTDDLQTQSIRSELRNLVGNIDISNQTKLSPSDELISKMHVLVKDKFDPLVDHIDEDTMYDTTDMVNALNEALIKINGHELGWATVKRSNSSNLAVSAHQREVEVGVNRKEIVGKDLKTKIIHEIGVHALRSINAERAGWLSAAYGQDGYLNYEESLGTAFEDVYNNKYKDRGENYYLIAGLVYGQDNHEPRDFNETYEIVWRNHLLSKNLPEINEKDVEAAKIKAFNDCVRLFRGTTGKQKGVILLKDLAYFQGQESVWESFKNVNNEQDLELLLAGKLDISKPDHKSIANLILEELSK